MAYQKDRIIVLYNIRHLESHLILKGINKEGVLLSFIAKFALKSKKRFAGGVLEPGGFIEVEYRPSTKDLHQIISAHILNKFEKIRSDYDRLALGLYVLKMTGQVGLSGGEGDPELFNLVGNTLSALETTNNLSALKLFFEMRFLLIQGVLPIELQNKNIFFENTIRNHQSLSLSDKDVFSIQQTLSQSLNHYLS